MEADQEEVIAADQERLVVDAFLRYRISDPLQFFRTLRDERTAPTAWSGWSTPSLRQVLGSASSTTSSPASATQADARHPRPT